MVGLIPLFAVEILEPELRGALFISHSALGAWRSALRAERGEDGDH